jgi:electron transport complex protein RnfB
LPNETDVYRALQQHLDTFPVGFPATESGVEIRMLKNLFTPEEAKIALRLTFSAFATDSLDTIYARFEPSDITRSELEISLDRMVEKGLLLFRQEGNQKFYNNAQLAVGIYEFQVSRLSPQFLADLSQYFKEAYEAEYFSARPTQLRILPVEKSLTYEDSVATYDIARELVNSSKGPFMVAPCICRKGRDLIGDPCKVTKREETCLGFGPFAQQYINQGWGREISRDELLKILLKNESEGLVLQASNSKEIHFLCSCCGCCCSLLRTKKRTPKPVELFTTNFYAGVDSDLCSGCETCLSLCQMDALAIKDSIASVNLDRCIGCGVCVTGCPEGAVSLYKRDKLSEPPTTLEDLYQAISESKRK